MRRRWLVRRGAGKWGIGFLAGMLAGAAAGAAREDNRVGQRRLALELGKGVVVSLQVRDALAVDLRL